MTLDARLVQKLNDLPPLQGQRQHLEFAFPGLAGRVALDVETLEQLGGALWELTVEPETAPTRPLLDHTRALAARLTGLLEPVALLECDAPRGVALLRSAQPLRQEQNVLYYELLVRADGHATLRRYTAAARATTRQQVPFVLTKEALAKIIADLATPVA